MQAKKFFSKCNKAYRGKQAKTAHEKAKNHDRNLLHIVAFLYLLQ